MKRNIIMSALVLAALFAFSTPASAARGRSGGRAAYRGGGRAVSHVTTRGGYRGGSLAGYRGYNRGYFGGYRGYNRGYFGGYGYGAGYGLGLTSGLLLGNSLGGYNYGYYPNYGYGNYNYGFVPSYNYSDYNYGYVPNYSYSNYLPPTTTYVDPIILSTTTAPATTRDSLYYAPEGPSNTAHLRILVPADAKVWVGGVETEKTGTDREFDSPPLTAGKEYTYEIKARWTEAGQPVERTRKVKVEANRTTTVDFEKVAAISK